MHTLTSAVARELTVDMHRSAAQARMIPSASSGATQPPSFQRWVLRRPAVRYA